MIGTGAFHRAKAMFAEITAAMSLPTLEQKIAFGRIEQYRSRGHGEGLLGNKHSRHCVAMDKRAATKARNKRSKK